MPLDLIGNRINIICEVHGTSIERLRRKKRVYGKDLNAMKEIARYLDKEHFLTHSEIADILFRDRSTISYYLEFDPTQNPYDNKLIPPPIGAHQSQG